jgi:predicted esterase
MHKRIRYALAGLLFVVQAALAQVATPERTGEYTVSMSPAEALGDTGAQNVAEILPPDRELSWQVYVPSAYSAARPAGVLVWISPTDRGGPPREWFEALDDRNLIWIGANAMGQRSGLAEQVVAAMIAPSVVGKRYEFDVNRIYVAGFSIGAYMAARVAAIRPELFRGSLFIGGAESWPEPPAKIDRIRRNRHVFLIGTRDPAFRDVRRVVGEYQDAGVEHARLFEVPDFRHQLPPAGHFLGAIGYLDDHDAE